MSSKNVILKNCVNKLPSKTQTVMMSSKIQPLKIVIEKKYLFNDGSIM